MATPPKPTRAQVEEWFKEIDKDGSGKLDVKELRQYVKGVHEHAKIEVDDAFVDTMVAVCCFVFFS